MEHDETRRLLAILIVGLLLLGIGGVWIVPDQPARPAGDNPTRALTGSTSQDDAQPDETAVPAGLHPVAVPADPYVPEAVRQIGTIEIPKLGLVSSVYEGVTLHNIDLGPSHWPGTANPGDAGNAVFAGHRVTHTHPFLHIDQLTPGDTVIFTVSGRRSVYTVTASQVVVPQDLAIVNQTTTPTATLFACHPPHSASYRYVVHLVLASPPG